MSTGAVDLYCDSSANAPSLCHLLLNENSNYSYISRFVTLTEDRTPHQVTEVINTRRFDWRPEFLHPIPHHLSDAQMDLHIGKEKNFPLVTRPESKKTLVSVGLCFVRVGENMITLILMSSALFNV